MAKKVKPHAMRKRNNRVNMGIERSVYAQKSVLPERHLFVTEGTKTEPLYLKSMFDCIAKKVGESAKQQLIVYGAGDNTLHLVDKAEDILKYAGTSSDKSKRFQHVWIVYDKDDFPPDRFDDTEKRCQDLNQQFQQNNQNRTFHAVWSNECFEVWLLYHFMFLTAGVQRSQYASMLAKYLGTPYQKNSPPDFSQLPWRTAAQNAKRQMASFSANVPPSQRNPCTNFYCLIEAFQNYL